MSAQEEHRDVAVDWKLGRMRALAQYSTGSVQRKAALAPK